MRNYCRLCRRTGHEASEECRSRRPTYAERAATTMTVDDVDADHVVEAQDVGEPAETTVQQPSEVSEVIPAGAAAAADAGNNEPPAASADESSDDDDQRGDQADDDADTTDTQVDADGFRRPTDHIRRQRRAKKRIAKKSPVSAEPVGAKDDVGDRDG